ncbi:MAG: tetratricopeptide repeat protein [Rivularia sp. (in: cyanobacteria)]
MKSQKSLFIALLLLSISTISCNKTNNSARKNSLLVKTSHNQTFSKAKDYFERAEDQVQQGDLKEAINSYNQAIDNYPKFTEAYNSRGDCKSKIKEL